MQRHCSSGTTETRRRLQAVQPNGYFIVYLRIVFGRKIVKRGAFSQRGILRPGGKILKKGTVIAALR